MEKETKKYGHVRIIPRVTIADHALLITAGLTSPNDRPPHPFVVMTRNWVYLISLCIYLFMFFLFVWLCFFSIPLFIYWSVYLSLCLGIYSLISLFPYRFGGKNGIFGILFELRVGRKLILKVEFSKTDYITITALIIAYTFSPNANNEMIT